MILRNFQDHDIYSISIKIQFWGIYTRFGVNNRYPPKNKYLLSDSQRPFWAFSIIWMIANIIFYQTYCWPLIVPMIKSSLKSMKTNMVFIYLIAYVYYMKIKKTRQFEDMFNNFNFIRIKSH